MVHTLLNWSDPQVKELVLVVYDQHRRNTSADGTEKKAKMKYVNTAKELLTQWGFNLDSKYIKNHHVSRHMSSTPALLLLLLTSLLRFSLQAELDAEYGLAGWEERRDDFKPDAYRSQLWQRYPNSMPAGSNPLGHSSFAASGALSSSFAPSSPAHARSHAAASVTHGILRNIHAELVSISQSQRILAGLKAADGSSREKTKAAAEFLQNGSVEDDEEG